MNILLFIIFSLIYSQNYNTSQLPIIVINTYDQDIVDEPRINAHMGIIDNDNNFYNPEAVNFNGYDGLISIEIRGNTSQSFPKKSYGLETILENGDNNNISLLGMPEENDWILYAPYTDKSLMRNVLAYNLSNKMGMYASRTRFCELFINDDYKGIYVLMEKIKRDSNRIDINKLKDSEIEGDDLTGGYIIEFNHDANEENSFQSNIDEMKYQYYYPDFDEMPTEQKLYIQEFINNFELVMIEENYNDPITGYFNIVDINSFIDMIILYELSKSQDHYVYSTFLYKDKDSIDNKLKAGPIWDINIGFGNADYGNTEPWLSTGWRISLTKDEYGSFWWSKIWEDEYFQLLLKARWLNLREDILSYMNINNTINNFILEIGQEAIDDNFHRWDVLGEYVWPNYIVFETYEEEIDYLKLWIQDRLHWIDSILTSGYINANEYYQWEISAYPNPFYKNINLDTSIYKNTDLIINAYNIQGQLIDQIINIDVHPNNYNFIWSPENLSSGIYFIVFQSNYHGLETKKVTLIK